MALFACSSMRNIRMDNNVKLRSYYCSEMIKDVFRNPRAQQWVTKAKHLLSTNKKKYIIYITLLKLVQFINFTLYTNRKENGRNLDLPASQSFSFSNYSFQQYHIQQKIASPPSSIKCSSSSKRTITTTSLLTCACFGAALYNHQKEPIKFGEPI